MAVIHLPYEPVLQRCAVLPSTTCTDLEDSCDVRRAASLLQRTQGMSKSPIQHVQHDIVPVYGYEQGRLVSYDYDTQGNPIGHLIVPRHLCRVPQQQSEIPHWDKKIQVV